MRDVFGFVDVCLNVSCENEFLVNDDAKIFEGVRPLNRGIFD